MSPRPGRGLLALALTGCGGTSPPTRSIRRLPRWARRRSRRSWWRSLSQFPPNDLYNYAYVLKYRVLEGASGQGPPGEILVAHYNPLKPRARVQDDFSGKMGGHVERFRAGDMHRMALEAPVDQFWMGGIIDKYFNERQALLGSLDESGVEVTWSSRPTFSFLFSAGGSADLLLASALAQRLSDARELRLLRLVGALVRAADDVFHSAGFVCGGIIGAPGASPARGERRCWRPSSAISGCWRSSSTTPSRPRT